MRHFYPSFVLLVITIICSCTKNDHPGTDCFPDASTVRQIMDAQATIKEVDGRFYIVEDGAIDTKINPCRLPTVFQVDKLPVIVSGDVKNTLQGESEPCCIEDFVISKISK